MGSSELLFLQQLVYCYQILVDNAIFEALASEELGFEEAILTNEEKEELKYAKAPYY